MPEPLAHICFYMDEVELHLDIDGTVDSAEFLAAACGEVLAKAIKEYFNADLGSARVQ